MFPAGGPGRLDVNIKSKSLSRRLRRAVARARSHLDCAEEWGSRRHRRPLGMRQDDAVAHYYRTGPGFRRQVELPVHGRLGVVFQEPRLLPWRSVEENVRLVAPQCERDRTEELFATLELAEHRRHYPSELSLGLARRVALARAFAVEPDCLCSMNRSSRSTPRLQRQIARRTRRARFPPPVTTLHCHAQL